MDSLYIDLHDEDEWEAFASANREALLEVYATLQDAHAAACQGGIVLGGGAAPLVEVHFVDTPDIDPHYEESMPDIDPYDIAD